MKQKVASVDEQASFFLFLTLHLGMDFEFRRVMDLWPLSVESAALASSSRAASWRRRHAAPQLPAMQTLEVPLDGANDIGVKYMPYKFVMKSILLILIPSFIV